MESDVEPPREDHVMRKEGGLPDDDAVDSLAQTVEHWSISEAADVVVDPDGRFVVLVDDSSSTPKRKTYRGFYVVYSVSFVLV